MVSTATTATAERDHAAATARDDETVVVHVGPTAVQCSASSLVDPCCCSSPLSPTNDDDKNNNNNNNNTSHDVMATAIDPNRRAVSPPLPTPTTLPPPSPPRTIRPSDPECWHVAMAARLKREWQRQPFRCCRAREQADLHQAYQAIRRASLSPSDETSSSSSSGTFLLLTGPDGSGKTHLAKTLQRQLFSSSSSLSLGAHAPAGYFITGKYDFLRRPAPYTASVAAATDFANQVAARGGAVTDTVRQAIGQAVGAEAPVLINMIPGLRRILGHPANRCCSSDESSSPSQQRFAFVFRSFVRAICSPEQPLITLLDDLQFADECSVDITISMLTDIKNNGLVMIGTCDDSILEQESYLSKRLREVVDIAKVQVKRIALHNLEAKDIEEMLKEAFHLPESTDQSKSLASFVSQLTNGNLYYIRMFLYWLLDSDLLCCDRDSGAWSWDEEEIRMTVASRKPEDFLIFIGGDLSPEMREMLRVAACLGSHLDERLLEYVLGVPVDHTMKQAADRGIIVEEDTRCGYKFAHNKVQEAAYRFIPEDERELFHLEIGRRLWLKLNPDELETHLFTLLSQLMMGRNFITREREQIGVAKLCLYGGTKAAKSSTFRTALTYLEFGISLLDEQSWQTDYELALSLYNAAVEMSVTTVDHGRREEFLEMIFRKAKKFRDKVQAYSMKVRVIHGKDHTVFAVKRLNFPSFFRQDVYARCQRASARGDRHWH